MYGMDVCALPYYLSFSGKHQVVETLEGEIGVRNPKVEALRKRLEQQAAQVL